MTAREQAFRAAQPPTQRSGFPGQQLGGFPGARVAQPSAAGYAYSPNQFALVTDGTGQIVAPGHHVAGHTGHSVLAGYPVSGYPGASTVAVSRGPRGRGRHPSAAAVPRGRAAAATRTHNPQVAAHDTAKNNFFLIKDSLKLTPIEEGE